VLAVRADEQERVPERLARRGQVEIEQLLVAADLRVEERPAALRRGAPEGPQRRVPAPVRAAHEEELRVRPGVALLGEVRLDLVGEPAPAERVARPEAPVLDEDPVVDAAGGGGERLGVRSRDLGAELLRAFRHPPPARARRSPGPSPPARRP
jgi:hypothetical protein